jgi:hypothetical protein
MRYSRWAWKIVDLPLRPNRVWKAIQEARKT